MESATRSHVYPSCMQSDSTLLEHNIMCFERCKHNSLTEQTDVHTSADTSLHNTVERAIDCYNSELSPVALFPIHPNVLIFSTNFV
jgi:hypothetical protein